MSSYIHRHSTYAREASTRVAASTGGGVLIDLHLHTGTKWTFPLSRPFSALPSSSIQYLDTVSPLHPPSPRRRPLRYRQSHRHPLHHRQRHRHPRHHLRRLSAQTPPPAAAASCASTSIASSSFTSATVATTTLSASTHASAAFASASVTRSRPPSRCRRLPVTFAVTTYVPPPAPPSPPPSPPPPVVARRARWRALRRERKRSH